MSSCVTEASCVPSLSLQSSISECEGVAELSVHNIIILENGLHTVDNYVHTT